MKNVMMTVTTMMMMMTHGCSDRQHNDLVTMVLSEAGSNSRELQAALDHYKETDKRIHATAVYTVGAALGRKGVAGEGLDSIEALYRSLPGKYQWLLTPDQQKRGRQYAAMPVVSTSDAEALTKEFIISNIDDAWALRKSRKWLDGLPDELFCEMLLPYRIDNEPLTLWRGRYRAWLSDLEDSLADCHSSVAAARMIAERIGSCHYNDQLPTPHRSALALLEMPLGYCRDDCDRTLYAMRAMGVPVAVDRILVSPENGAGHSWTVVWDNIDGLMRLFDNGAYLPTRDSIYYDQRRKGKIYRSTFAPELERLARYREAVSPPQILLDSHLKDVTSEYFGHNRAEVELWSNPDGGHHADVYLGVFAGGRFNPVDIATLRGGKAIFTDIEPNMIFAPVTSDGYVCGYPFMLDSDGGVVSFIPSDSRRDKLTLTRKYPIRFHLRERMASVVGLHVQTGPTPHGPWRDLEVIESAPNHNYRRISFQHRLPEQYLRLYKRDGKPALISMLMACRDSLGLDCIPLSVAGSDESRNRYERILIPDQSFQLDTGAEDCVVKIEASPSEVKSVFLIPPNDDNCILPEQEYELMFFAGADGWKSAGKKTATGFSLDFEAPAGALLWLRNLTKGREEQIFIWRKGRQMFNIDLYEAPCFTPTTD